MIKKRIVAFMTVLSLVISMTACGGNDSAAPASKEVADTAKTGGAGEKKEEGAGDPFADYDYYNWDYILCAALTHERTANFENFVNAVSERTNGHLTIKLLGLGEHPYTTSEFISIVDQGLAEMGDPTGSSNLSELSSIATVTLPFLIADMEEYRATDMAIRDIIIEELEGRYNCLGLGLIPETPQVLAGTGKPLTDLASMSGRKYRGQNSFGMEYVESVGGYAVNVSFSELASAMSTGVINAFNTGCDSISSGALYDICDWVSQYAMNFSHALITVNKDAYESLPEEFQIILREEAANFEKNAWDTIQARCDSAYEIIGGSSCELIDFKPEFMEEAFAHAKDSGMYDKWINENGEYLVKAYKATLEALGK